MKTAERLRTDWVLATEISKLESRLWRHTRRDLLQTVMVTSAIRGEGKSTTLAYLATAMGMYPNRKVLAIDFDFRIPSLNSHFGLKVKCGVDRVLEGKAKVQEALLSTGLPGLTVALPSKGGADPSLLLRTPELVEMMASLRASFDLILLDVPAIIPVADATTLMPLADGVVLVAMSGKTTQTQLRRAYEICHGLDANILGLVVGNIQEAAPEYLADEYNYQGYNHGRAHGESADAR